MGSMRGEEIRYYREVEQYLKNRPGKDSSEIALGSVIHRMEATQDFMSFSRSVSNHNRSLWSILDTVLKLADKTFTEKLMGIIKKSGKQASDIYSKAGITKQHFSKIKNNREYKPSKETVLAFAIVLHLTLEETRELLESAGFSLSHSSKRDLIVEYFISKGIYDVDAINYNLDACGYSTLTNRRNG